jgi:ElaB/YqjD/DUF883 family membrane-anchored ribosome-binding protein
MRSTNLNAPFSPTPASAPATTAGLSAQAAEALGGLSERVGETVAAAKHTLAQGSEKLHESADALRHKATEELHHVQEQLAAGKENIKDAFDDLASNATRIGDGIGAYVRENPAKSVAMALAAGMLISRAFNTRRHR